MESRCKSPTTKAHNKIPLEDFVKCINIHRAVIQIVNKEFVDLGSDTEGSYEVTSIHPEDVI